MRKIPNKIVEMIEERNRLNEQINEFVNEEIGDDVYWDIDNAEIVSEEKLTGKEYGNENCREWCDQTMLGEDYGSGFHYWETENKEKFLRMYYEF